MFQTWETKANDAEDAASRLRREKEDLSEELTEKERAATSQDLVSVLCIYVLAFQSFINSVRKIVKTNACALSSMRNIKINKT